jgi:hypothetical protein
MGLSAEHVPSGWSIADDVATLGDKVRPTDVLCGAGWAASTVLLAAAIRTPRAVVLYAPPIGIDLSAMTREVRSVKDARAFMSRLGGDVAYWDRAQQATNFLARVDAYVSQDVPGAASRVRAPVIVVTREPSRNSNKAGEWTYISGTPGQVPALVAASLRS